MADIAGFDEHEQLQQLEAAQALAELGSWQVDFATGRTTWSAEMHRHYGTDPTIYVPGAESYIDFVHPDDRERLAADVAAMSPGVPSTGRYRTVRATGEIRVMQSWMQFRLDENGQPVGMFGSAMDVTKNQQIEDEREQALTRLADATREATWRRRVLEDAERLAGLGSWTIDPATGATIWSPQMYLICGLDPSEYAPTPTSIYEFLLPEDRPVIDQAMEELTQTGLSVAEHRIRRPDGKVRTLLTRGRAELGDDGQMIRLTGTLQDITEAREQAQAQARARAELEEAQRIAGIGSFSVDLATGSAVWSPQLYRLLGVEPDSSAPVRETFFDLFPEEKRSDIRALVDAAIDRDEPYEVEHAMNLRNGESRILLERGQATRVDGRPAQLNGTIQDVTQARRSERALLEARDLFQQVLAAATDQAIIGADLDHQITIFNRGAELMLGYTAEEMIGTDRWRDLHDPSELPPSMLGPGLEPPGDEVDNVFAGRNEWTYIRKDGKRLRVELSTHPLSDHEGNPTGFLAVATDVTRARELEAAQVRAREELVETRDLFEQVLTAATAQAIIGTDAHGTVTIFNRGAEQLLGYPAEEMIGTDRWRDLHDPAELPWVARDFAPDPETDPRLRGPAVGGMDEWTFIRRDGTRLRAMVSVTPMQDHQGKLAGFLTIAADVTRARELEAAQAQARVELEEAQQLAEVGSFTLDMRTNRAVWSPQMYRIFGLDPDTADPGTDSWLSFIPEEDRAATIALMDSFLNRGESYEFEHEIVARDGVARAVRERGRMVLDDDGRPMRLHGTAQDITEARRAEHELLEARDLFQQLLEAATDQAIIGTDRNHRISIFNRGAELMLGYTTAEMLGTQDWRLLHDPDELMLLVDAAAQNLTLEEGWPQIEAVFRDRPEWTYIRKDGQRLRVQVSMHAMRDHAGELTGMLSVVTDVTRARELEEAQAQARAELEEAQRIAEVGSYTIDFSSPSERPIWSKYMHQIYASDPQSDPPTFAEFLAYIPPDERDHLGAVMLDSSQTGEPFEFEHTIIRGDGQVRTVLERGQGVFDEFGNLLRLAGTAQDVTEVRRIERGMIDAQDLFQQVLSAATDQAILSLDTDGRLTLFNKGAERMLGYTAEEMLGRSPWSVFRPQSYLDTLGEDEGSVDAVYLTSLASDDDVTGTPRPMLPGEQDDREWLCKNGDIVTVLTNITPMRDHEGNVTGYLCIATDVTEQRETERARDRAEREVQAAMQEISDARDEAMAANQAKSSFLATMSHEIRTPMNAVIGMTSLLLDTELDADQRDLLETVRGSGDQLLAIINDILDFSKIEAGDLDLESVPFDLRDVVESTLAQFAGSAKGIDLLSHIDDACPVSVIGDPTRLRQVLSNLIGNALKFTADGDVLVHVTSTDQDGDQVNLMFQVRDTGIGIPEESMHRLFKSFSQVDASTTRTYGGTGLGLAISRALVTAMGGDIWVESTVGEGSTFSFTVQLGRDAEGPAAKVGSLDALTLREALAGRRVLVVDDNETNRRILSMQLASYSADAVEAPGSVEALQLVTDPGQHFDLIVLDLVMPVLDGVQLAGAIKRMPGREELPVILLSSLGRKLPPEEEGLFAAVLTKPVRSMPLMEAFATAMGATPDTVPPGDSASSTASTVSTASSTGSSPAPVAGGEVPAQGGPREVEATPPKPALRILLAEDNEVNQKVGRLMLAKLGHRADIVANGELALEAARAHDYDVVLMDMHMPVMDGLEATRRIRGELSAWRQPIIIAMTASVTMEDREACAEAGMNDYLSKPVRPEALASVLAAVSEARHAGR